MSVEQIYYEIEFSFRDSKYSTNKEDINLACSEIKSKFKEYQVDYTKTDEKFIYFSLYVGGPSSVANIYGNLSYPASIEKDLNLFIEEVSKKYNLLDSK
ncbi:hypothetical protein [Solibacillus daqui]|uniref:hypothetical protein n=1 Tax=Solibacillus daqui TaxID=2912187 RepID=UPI0023662F0F|nr:hypothetical protein [Solibacillus daqui]